ncbi:tRNA(5-methylaminomethyl-2-thiouridylate) methyltransferase [Maridesulfovibrio bastinii]|uniref:tRNA(5-methylaminomethyl-2-thiouridylate) methyltransferase n=1 Tax=Maridesulfovibrio bastinii TaxID=47157 RepID=UPI001FE1B37E|nr:tRNA(5-methylaminomethyl-2-thiouridylate) methyltransferase [Maridesulfovibrio bastinii]
MLLRFDINEGRAARMETRYDALALFSGGLDSILASRVIQDQGLKVLGLHYVSPFFGKPDKIDHWSKIYGVDIVAVDISREYIEMMFGDLSYGMGKLLNPCVDCKIFMLNHAKTQLERYGASFLISGEVIGQRPMSQRKDALNSIRRDAEVSDVLLRPLCAASFAPTPMEKSGLVDRDRLPHIFGRGRKQQLRMAREYGFTEIPSPAGGCRLTEVENSARYFPLFRYLDGPDLNSFKLANHGRHYWSGLNWLVIGRNNSDNQNVEKYRRDGDYGFELIDYPGPYSLGRNIKGDSWSDEAISEAAAFVASYSGKAVASNGPVRVNVTGPEGDSIVEVLPERDTVSFAEGNLDDLKEWKIATGRKDPAGGD